MRLSLAALVAGLAAAILVSGLRASAADVQIAATAGNQWSPSSVQIDPGDSVTWSNPTTSGGSHNVCVAKPGSAAGCDEFRNGDVAPPTWQSSHTFTLPGVYKFVCQAHPAMTGTVTVGSTGTATTSPGTITGTVPTQTDTSPPAPTETETTASTPAGIAPADTTAPAFTARPKRRASRRALIVDLGSSEAATLQVTVLRRPPHRRAFGRIGKAAAPVKTGRNIVKLPRKATGSLRAGAYRLKLVLIDAAGNRSVTRTLVFKLAA